MAEIGEPVKAKIKDLTPTHKQVSLTAKVLNVSEAKEIPSRFGPARKVAEATIGDDSGTVVLSLWQDQIGTISANDVISIENGYVSLVRGHIRLNVGKYGKIEKVDVAVENVNTENDISAKEHEATPRHPRRNMGRRREGGFRPRGGNRF